eukprot:INCI10258.1.p1 GENE.INCI10258.1~~INCI10258.1.p1  ORF type:complete len:616 (+),score=77.63 INCI10258.1:211-2058(+)
MAEMSAAITDTELARSATHSDEVCAQDGSATPAAPPEAAVESHKVARTNSKRTIVSASNDGRRHIDSRSHQSSSLTKAADSSGESSPSRNASPEYALEAEVEDEHRPKTRRRGSSARRRGLAPSDVDRTPSLEEVLEDVFGLAGNAQAATRPSAPNRRTRLRPRPSDSDMLSPKLHHGAQHTRSHSWDPEQANRYSGRPLRSKHDGAGDVIVEDQLTFKRPTTTSAAVSGLHRNRKHGLDAGEASRPGGFSRKPPRARSSDPAQRRESGSASWEWSDLLRKADALPRPSTQTSDHVASIETGVRETTNDGRPPGRHSNRRHNRSASETPTVGDIEQAGESRTPNQFLMRGLFSNAPTFLPGDNDDLVSNDGGVRDDGTRWTQNHAQSEDLSADSGSSGGDDNDRPVRRRRPRRSSVHKNGRERPSIHRRSVSLDGHGLSNESLSSLVTASGRARSAASVRPPSRLMAFRPGPDVGPFAELFAPPVRRARKSVPGVGPLDDADDSESSESPRSPLIVSQVWGNTNSQRTVADQRASVTGTAELTLEEELASTSGSSTRPQRSGRQPRSHRRAASEPPEWQAGMGDVFPSRGGINNGRVPPKAAEAASASAYLHHSP